MLQSISLEIDSKTVTNKTAHANHANNLPTSITNKLLHKSPKKAKRF